MIQPEELPKEIGLIYFNENTEQLRTVRKAAFRTIEIPRTMLEYIIMAKVDSDRHPYFNTQREELEAWVQDCLDRKSLSRHVQQKLRQQLNEIEMNERDIDDKRWLSEREKQIWHELREELERRGVNFETYQWKEHLQTVLIGSVPATTEGWIDQLYHDLFELRRLASPSNVN